MANNPALVAGLRILVLEDEALVAMLIEEMIGELGGVVVGPIETADRALNWLRAEAVDAALLDLSLGEGGSGYAVADALAARAVPFAFVTGYGAEMLREPYADRPVLQKPFQIDLLCDVLADLASMARG